MKFVKFISEEGIENLNSFFIAFKYISKFNIYSYFYFESFLDNP
jgi:hypothetical protein